MNRLGNCASTLAISLFVFGTACDSGSPGGDDSTTSTTADDTADDTASGDGDGDSAEAESGDGDGETTTTGPEVVGSLSGTVKSADGTPYDAPGGQLCGPVDEEGAVGACRTIEEDANGDWTIDLYEAGDYNLKWVHPPEGDTHYSTVLELINVAEGDNVSEQNWVIPVVDSTVDLTDAAETVVDMSGGLMVTINPADMDWAFLEPLTGGVMIPDTDWRYDNVNDEPVVGIWAMTPFGAHPDADDGTMSFTLDNGLGLPADTAVNFYEINKENAWIVPAGTGAVSADGMSIVPDQGFHYISWFIVTRAA